MINMVVRGVVLLWAALFLLTGVQGLTAAAPYFDLAGPLLDPTGRNTVRADLSSFFLVAATFAVMGVVRSGWTHALLVPAALFGTALLGRLLGVVAFGDGITAAITQAMIAEAISVALLLGAWWHLSRSAVAPAATDANVTDLPD
jgi:energy-converting hydrogenase Eha subunit H